MFSSSASICDLIFKHYSIDLPGKFSYLPGKFSYLPGKFGYLPGKFGYLPGKFGYFPRKLKGFPGFFESVFWPPAKTYAKDKENLFIKTNL